MPASAAARSNAAQVRPKDLGIGVLFWIMWDAALAGDATTSLIVLWNSATEHLFGWSADKILGAPIEILVSDRLRLAPYLETGAGSTRARK